MRTRLSRRTDRALARGWSVAALAFALLLVALRLLAPGFLLAGAAPLFAAGNGLSAEVAGLFARMGDARALARANTALSAENQALVLENQGLAEKVRDLAVLAGTTTPAARGIVAGVIARPPEAPYDTLILAGGAAAGIAPRMAVVGPGGTPLGLVERVTAGFARARLFTAAGATTDAWVGASRVPIFLRGAGGSFTASAPQGAGVVQGDLVYLAGPVPIARVARVGSGATDPVATLSIAPLVNPLSLTSVRIVETPASASSTLLAEPPPAASKQP